MKHPCNFCLFYSLFIVSIRQTKMKQKLFLQT